MFLGCLFLRKGVELRSIYFLIPFQISKIIGLSIVYPAIINTPIKENIKTIKPLFGSDFSLGITTGLIIVNIGVFFFTSIAVLSLFNANSLYIFFEILYSDSILEYLLRNKSDLIFLFLSLKIAKLS